MARAKRFDRDRAEARRRHRATLAGKTDRPEEETEGEVVDAGEGAAAKPASPPARRPGQPRMGLVAAARTAYRRVELRRDLAGLPRLVRHRSFLIPALMSLGSALIFIALGPSNIVAKFAFEVLVYPPAMAAVFIAGFFAPTAGWLAGGLVGFAAAVYMTIAGVIASQGGIPDIPASGTGLPGLSLDPFIVGVTYGMVLAAAAAWYRRFLYLSSPARPAARAAGGKGNGQRGARPRARGR